MLEVCSLPNKGIASDTCGKVSATKLRNTVSDRRIVTPIKNSSVGFLIRICFSFGLLLRRETINTILMTSADNSSSPQTENLS